MGQKSFPVIKVNREGKGDMHSKGGSFIMPVKFHPMNSDLFNQFCIFSNDHIRVSGFSATETKDHFHSMGQVGHKLFHVFIYDQWIGMFRMV